MEIIIKAEPKEIAALALAAQEQQKVSQINVSDVGEETRQRMIAFLEDRIHKLENNQPIM